MASTITTSVVTGGTNSHATSSAEVNAVATDFIHSGVAGPITNTSGVAPNTGSFAVNAQGTPAMFVDVTAGSAWITATPSGQTSQKLRANMTANYTSYAISSNSSGSTKYDWIYLSVDATKANNPASDASDVTSLYTSRSSSNTTDNGTPPTYGLLLAVVTVANGASSITNSSISDKRTVATFRSSPASGGVNSIDISTASTGNAPALTAQGSDANINLVGKPKGAGIAYGFMATKVGSFATPAATGNLAVTGVGFKPKAVLFFQASTNASNAQTSNGAMDSSGNQWAQATASRNTFVDQSTGATNACILIYSISGAGTYTLQQQANYVSMDSDGFTINFTTTATTGNNVGWIAIG